MDVGMVPAKRGWLADEERLALAGDCNGRGEGEGTAGRG